MSNLEQLLLLAGIVGGGFALYILYHAVRKYRFKIFSPFSKLFRRFYKTDTRSHATRREQETPSSTNINDVEVAEENEEVLPDDKAAKWLLSEITRYDKKFRAKMRMIQTGEIDPTDYKREMRPVKVRLWLYWAINCLVISLITVGLFFSVTKTGSVSLGGFKMAIWPFLWMPQLAYVALSIRVVYVNDIAGASFFGIPIAQFGTGPKLVWLGIVAFEKESASIVQAEVPGDQDKIFRGDEKQELPVGMVRPIRVLFNENTEGSLPTELQIAVDVSSFVMARILPDQLFTFIRKVNPIDETQKEQVLATLRTNKAVSPRMLELLRYLIDTNTKILKEIAGRMSYNQVNSYLGLVNKLVLIRMQYSVVEFGVIINNAGITSINAGHEYNKAIQGRSTAIAERDARITQAKADRVELEERGAGAATAKRLDLEALASGLASTAEVLKIEGEEAMRTFVAQELARSGNMTILGQTGLDQLLGLVLAKTSGAK